MRYVCYFVIFFHVLCLVLSLMGRQTFALHTSQGTYDRAIYAEEDHDPTSRVFTVSVNDDIFVWANEEDQIELTTHLAISLMFALGAVPLIFAYWFLSRVFANISEGQIFTEQNASCLLYYGLMQMIVAPSRPAAQAAGVLSCQPNRGQPDLPPHRYGCAEYPHPQHRLPRGRVHHSVWHLLAGRGGPHAMIIIRLDRVLADRKMRLNELAALVGISNVNLSYLKTGKVRAVRFSTLNAICKALHCQPGDILEYTEDDEEEAEAGEAPV